jgi:hypothetical protein
MLVQRKPVQIPQVVLLENGLWAMPEVGIFGVKMKK